MKTLALLAVFLALPALSLAAGDGRNFGIQAPPDWTPGSNLDPDVTDVSIDSWFTEGTTIISAGVFIGPLLQGQLRDIDATVFIGSGRTICLNATAEHQGQSTTRVSGVPVCKLFPKLPLAPPILLAP